MVAQVLTNQDTLPHRPYNAAMAKQKKYWLFKTEPTTYSIHDLANEPRKTTCWEGVRNYQARNMLRDEVQKGDSVLIYHSNANPPTVVGTGTVVRDGYPDHFAWNPQSKYYDEKSDEANPRWFMVDLKLNSIFARPVPLPELRRVKALAKMELLRKGSRLSIQPATAAQFRKIVNRANNKA
jgi:predicted RNA-binding protein with PUA-like domain